MSSKARRDGSKLRIVTIWVAGIFASLLFQIYASSYLGAESFGLLASLLSLTTWAGFVGSSVQSIIAIEASETRLTNSISVKRTSLISWFVGVSVVTGLVAVIPLAHLIRANLLSTVVAISSFLLLATYSVLLGTYQGEGDPKSAFKISTTYQGLRLALLALCVALNLGANAIFVFSTLAVAVAILFERRKIRLILRKSINLSISPIIWRRIILSFLLGWSLNSDLILVRSFGSEELSGKYAVASIFAKYIFIAPGFVSIYFYRKLGLNEVKVNGKREKYFLFLAITGFSILAAAAFFIIIPVAKALNFISIAFDETLTATLTLSNAPFALLIICFPSVLKHSSKQFIAFVCLFIVIQVLVFAFFANQFFLLVPLQTLLGFLLLMYAMRFWNLQKFPLEHK